MIRPTTRAEEMDIGSFSLAGIFALVFS